VRDFSGFTSGSSPSPAELGRRSADQAALGLLSDSDPDEDRHRRRAVARHFSRWLRQLATIVTAVLAAMFASGANKAIYLHYTGKIGSGTTQTWVQNVVATYLPFAVLALIVAAIASLLWYLREQSRYWRLRASEAHQREPDHSALGYMGVFRIYARTNRVSQFTTLYGIVALFFAGQGLTLAIVNAPALPDAGAVAVLVGLPVLDIALAVWLLKLGYEIGRRFVPGRILAKATVVLSLLAATSQTDYTTAQIQAQPHVDRIRNDRPWWFYAFRHRRKGSFKTEGGWNESG
jgi:hypothetical protein